MERVVRRRSFTLSKTFYSDGVAATPAGTPTVAIVRASDATTVTTSSVAGTGAGPYTVTVIASDNLLLDTLTVTWTATIGGQANTYADIVEVAGDTLFSIAEAQALPGLATTAVADIVKARTRAEQILERRLHDAFVPRYRQETLTGDGGCALLLSMPRVRSIRSITIDGTALTPSDLALLVIGPAAITGRWWRGNITVGYEHGWDAPQEPVREAALAMANFYLTNQPGQEGVDPRVRYITTPEGRIDYGTDGLGLPEVDRVISLYDMNLGVA